MNAITRTAIVLNLSDKTGYIKNTAIIKTLNSHNGKNKLVKDTYGALETGIWKCANPIFVFFAL